MGSVAGGGDIQPAIGALIGIMLTPDLDVDNGFIGDAIIRNRIGYWAERGWDMLWYFYRKSLKHGSELSHFPIISTVFRLAYLFLFLLVIPYCLFALVIPGAWTMESELQWWVKYLVEHYRVIVGLMASDLIHWALDVATTEHKQGAKVKCKSMKLSLKSLLPSVLNLNS